MDGWMNGWMGVNIFKSTSVVKDRSRLFVGQWGHKEAMEKHEHLHHLRVYLRDLNHSQQVVDVFRLKGIDYHNYHSPPLLFLNVQQHYQTNIDRRRDCQPTLIR